MARGDVYAHTVLFTRSNLHKQVAQDAMVLAHLVVGLHVLAKGNQVVAAILRLLTIF